MPTLQAVTALLAAAVTTWGAAPPTPPPPAPPATRFIQTQTAPPNPDAEVPPLAAGRADSVRCTSTSPTPVPDGRPIVISLPPVPPFTIGRLGRAYWNRPPTTDAAWQMWWYSLRWVGPPLARAVADGQNASREALIGEVLRFYRDHPDRGTPTLGWDEGSSLRRLETLNCLFRITHDRRLTAGMTAEARVLFGPRYYGPPSFAVHNHGLMANLRLVEAGLLTGRIDWVAAARARMRSEAGLAFSPRGTSYEQSSSYQAVNRDLWQQAATILTSLNPLDPVIPTIRATVARATTVTQWLTEPDGQLVQIGDAARSPGKPAPTNAPGILRDDAAGLIVGRWSFTDPTTSYYTLRYGPAVKAHGHPDKGSVTFTTRGARVLVGSGYYAYDPASAWMRYQNSPQATNTAIPVGGRLRSDTARLYRSANTARTHRWTVTDAAFGRAHSRTVTVDHPGRALTVADAFAGRAAADQYWHLDPAWQVASARGGARTARFRHPDGHSLTITTTGALAQAVRGATRPVAGWTFPEFGTRTANWQLRIRLAAGRGQTTFTVR